MISARELKKRSCSTEASNKGSQRVSRQIYHSMGDGARDVGGLAEQSRASKRTGRS
jgi:hypothetical protein